MREWGVRKLNEEMRKEASQTASQTDKQTDRKTERKRRRRLLQLKTSHVLSPKRSLIPRLEFLLFKFKFEFIAGEKLGINFVGI